MKTAYLLGICLLIGLTSYAGAGDSVRVMQRVSLAQEQVARGQTDSSWASFGVALEQSEACDQLGAYLRAIRTYGAFLRDQQHDAVAASLVYAAALPQPWRLPQRPDEWQSLAWLYVNAGYTYAENLGDYAAAKDAYTRAWRIFSEELQEDNLLTASHLHRYLGNIHTRLGDLPAAQYHLQRMLSLALQHGDHNLAADAYSDLGTLYLSWDKPDQAESAYRSGLSFAELSPLARLPLLDNLAALYAQQQQPQRASSLWQLALGLYDPLLADSASPPVVYRYLYQTYLGIAKMNLANGCPNDARTALERSREALTHFSQHERREYAKLAVLQADYYRQQKEFWRAVDGYQAALRCLLPNYNPTSLTDLPDPATFYAENTIAEALYGQALAWRQIFAQSEDLEHLTHALACHHLLFPAAQSLRRDLMYEQSQFFTLEVEQERTEEAIDLALYGYELTGAVQYQEQAFLFAERNKSILLLSAVRQHQHHRPAASYALDRTINQAEQALFAARETLQPDSTRQRLEAHLLQLRQQQQQLQPDSLSLGATVTDWRTAAATLQADETAINYFIGPTLGVAFVFDRNELRAVRLPRAGDLTARVQELRRDIEAFQFGQADRSALAECYTQQAQALYTDLVAPLQPYLHTSQLLVLPSGSLALLPFDALLVAPPKRPGVFEEYPYLLREFAIRYGYSASLEAHLHQTTPTSGGFLGLAPDFAGSAWPTLLCSGDQLTDLAQSRRDAVYRGPAASLARLQDAPPHAVVHMATHAEANTQDGRFSFVVLSDGQDGLDSVYVTDISLLQLRAELVVLSACETGSGEVYRGEGVINLARGFLSSGAHSLLTTLWTINENANCDLMGHFYHELRAGASKSAALHRAKLAYMDEHNRLLAHPVFWSSFALVGEPRPVYPRLSWASVAMLLSGSLFVLGGGYWLYHSRRGGQSSRIPTRRHTEVRSARSARAWS